MDDILEKLIPRDSGSVLERMFDGHGFLKTLDSYGEETLDAMFGSEMRKSLYKLGEVTHLITSAPGSGGLVAAAVAVRPWAHVGKLVQLGLVSKLMNNKAGLKYLTEGFDVPTTRAASMFITRFISMMDLMYEDSNIGVPNGSQ